MKILITGGCGFLGQHLTKDLVESFPDSEIKIIDLKSNPCQFYDFKDKNIKIILNKDITKLSSIKSEFKNTDTVIHLAGIVSFSLKDKKLLENVNVLGTRNVLKASLENKVKHFIHISSVAALGYNNDKNNPINENFQFDWCIAKKKKKYYMLTKHLADKEIQKFQKDIKITTLYPGLMFGPGDLTNSAKLINAIKQKKIPFNMPGGTNIIDVRDVSKGIVGVIKKKVMSNDFLLSGKNLTFTEINKCIADLTSAKPPSITLPGFLNPLLFHILLLIESISKKKLPLTADNLDSAFKFRYFNNNKAKEILDWKPQIEFQKTIKDTIKWMDENDLTEG